MMDSKNEKMLEWVDDCALLSALLSALISYQMERRPPLDAMPKSMKS